MRVVDGINPFDIAIPKARRAGVTSVVVAPGSTNVIGGQAAVIKLSNERDVKKMIVKAPCAIKCATGDPEMDALIPLLKGDKIAAVAMRVMGERLLLSPKLRLGLSGALLPVLPPHGTRKRRSPWKMIIPR